eukprot:scaffold270258_cov67-Attheya_sp.AAC.2
MKSTIKAVGENACIRSTNQDKMGYHEHTGFAMIVLEDGAQVGQVPAAVTRMNHCLHFTESVLGMINVQINTFVKAYGEYQAVKISAQHFVPTLECTKNKFTSS